VSQSFVIRPIGQQPLLDFGELWNYRDLLYILVWRALKVRYQQTVIGVGWALLQPVLLTFVFTIIFGLLAKMPTNGVPYPIFVLSGLLVWLFVAQSFPQASTSVVVNAQLITRIYFPRVLLLVAAIATSFVDFLCTFLIVVVLMAWYGVVPTIGALMFLPMLLLAALTVFGLSLWFSALNVRYRDIGHVIPFVVQLWMFLSPVIYPTNLLPPKYQFLYALNPLVVVIDTSRWAFAGGTPPSVSMVAVSVIVAVMLCITGLWFFRRHEGTFADIV
jgi:lipopolysaccharide transport system permease protein